MMHDNTAIVIAAGGQGSRIGGDKAGRLLGGKPLITYVINWAKLRAANVALAVREGRPDIGLGLPQVFDKRDDLAPINALEVAFGYAEKHSCDQVMVLGCDMPFLPGDLLDKLVAAIGDNGAALPQTGEFAHPLAGLWRVDRPALESYLASGERALWKFARQANAVMVEWPESAAETAFLNVNDEAGLAQAERHLARVKPG